VKIYIALANAVGGYVWNTEEGINAMKIYLAGAATGNNNAIWRNNANTPHEAMKIFLAGAQGWGKYAHDDYHKKDKSGLIDQKMCVLESFYYMQDWMKPYIRDYWDFLLDSGAFTFMNDKKNSSGVDWDAYLTRYIKFINEMNIDQFFELDIDDVVGIKKVEELRDRLESETGKKSIPVWHKSRGKEYWFKMCEEYDYVALGGMAINVSYKDKVEEVFPWFLSEARKRKTKVHALGYTSLIGMEKYKFYSVDSTSWIYGNRGGYLYQFNGRTLDKIDKPKGTRLKSRAVAIHNFKEWVKFQQYALTNL
tara:strand:+ start:1929 stop:2852 length:924 start_codon:yes stop_codon:yes gene_type:complete